MEVASEDLYTSEERFVEASHSMRAEIHDFNRV